MKKIIIILALFLISLPIMAGVGKGSTLVGGDFLGVSYSEESHNAMFAGSTHYTFGFRGEYVPYASKGGFALGLQPSIYFGIGDINVNPIMMGNLVFHFSRKGVLDPFAKLGAGMTRISTGMDIPNPNSATNAKEHFTVSDGYFQVNLALGTNIWIGRIGIVLDVNAMFMERNMIMANMGVVYKIRSKRSKKSKKKKSKKKKG